MTTLADFVNRVHKNARHFGRWARRRGIQCYRIYDRDIPEFAFALDVYGVRAHLQEYDRAASISPDHERWLGTVWQAAAEALGLEPEQVVLKRRPRRRSGQQHERTGESGEDFVVEEGGSRFIINLHAYLDTGLFLDHRNTRALVRSEARGRRFLNLFCYTGAFTVYAAAGEASTSLSVDLSNTYLEWARRNFALNGLDPVRHRLERADVLAWLPRAAEQRLRYDLIVLDPPSFSNSKSMQGILDIQRDYPALLTGCGRLLERGGVLYFSTNLRTFRFAPASAGELAGEEISRQTLPEEFRDRRVHRCWRFVRRDDPS